MSKILTWQNGGKVFRAALPGELPEVQMSDVLANLKAARDAALSGGVTVNGISVQTDNLSQQRLTAAALAAQIDPAGTVRWKTADGFVTLTAAQIVAVAMAVRAHVQACFDREAELMAEIEASDTPEAVDISTGWPVAEPTNATTIGRVA